MARFAFYRLLAEEARTIQFGIARAAEIHFAAGATEVYPNVGPIPVIEYGRLPEFEAKRLEPADLRLEAFHPMSTARMGADPAANVIRTAPFAAPSVSTWPTPASCRRRSASIR